VFALAGHAAREQDTSGHGPNAAAALSGERFAGLFGSDGGGERTGCVPSG
jgi:hypothetical protein